MIQFVEIECCIFVVVQYNVVIAAKMSATASRNKQIVADFLANQPSGKRERLKKKLDALPLWEQAGYCSHSSVANVTSFIARWQNAILARWRSGDGGGNKQPSDGGGGGGGGGNQPDDGGSSSSSSGSESAPFDIFGGNNDDSSSSSSDSGEGMMGLFG